MVEGLSEFAEVFTSMFAIVNTTGGLNPTP
jgi:hypothetical protein